MKQRLKLLFVCASLIVATNSSAVTIYKSVTDDGIVRFSDHPINNASNQQKLNIHVKKHFQAKKNTDGVPNKVATQDNQIESIIVKRSHLQKQIKLNYAELDAAQKVLKQAKQEQQQELQKCYDNMKTIEAKAKQGSVVLCQPSSLAPLENQIAKIQASINKFKTQLDGLPR